MPTDYFTLRVKCKRYPDEFKYIFYFFAYEDGSIEKIGQRPSLADLQLSQWEKYDKIIGREYVKELKTGTGLYAHGVGIGSFVYLRRVFGYLIEEAKNSLESDGKVKVKNYPSRMDEKIVFLKDYLPKFLVKHRAIYGVVSKGIHELSEDECLSYFDAIKVGIEQILDEKLEMFEKEEREKEREKQVETAIAKVRSAK